MTQETLMTQPTTETTTEAAPSIPGIEAGAAPLMAMEDARFGA